MDSEEGGGEKRWAGKKLKIEKWKLEIGGLGEGGSGQEEWES